jgi:hypothetical protein
MEFNERKRKESFYPRRYFPPPSNPGVVTDVFASVKDKVFYYTVEKVVVEAGDFEHGGKVVAPYASGWCVCFVAHIDISAPVSFVFSRLDLSFDGFKVFEYPEFEGVEVKEEKKLEVYGFRDDKDRMKLLLVYPYLEQIKYVYANFYSSNHRGL